MSDRLFLDPNVFPFAARHGVSFPDALRRLQSIGDLVTDVKGLQEIVYRFHLLGATKEGYERAVSVRHAAEVFPIREEELETQSELMWRYPNFRPRELLHAAVMLNHGISEILCDPESGYRDMEEIHTRGLASTLQLVL